MFTTRLSSVQRKAVDVLIRSENFSSTMKTVRVDEHTLCCWLADEDFRLSLIGVDDGEVNAHTRWLIRVPDGVTDILSHLSNEDIKEPAVRIQDVQEIVDWLLFLRRFYDLDRRISRLEEIYQIKEMYYF